MLHRLLLNLHQTQVSNEPLHIGEILSLCACMFMHDNKWIEHLFIYLIQCLLRPTLASINNSIFIHQKQYCRIPLVVLYCWFLGRLDTPPPLPRGRCSHTTSTVLGFSRPGRSKASPQSPCICLLHIRIAVCQLRFEIFFGDGVTYFLYFSFVSRKLTLYN